MEHHSLLSVVSYRCVCGNSIALVSGDDRSCLKCGRAIPPSALQTGDQTIINGLHATETHLEEVDPLIQSRLKHFRILEPLGQGGMGTVYRAVDESLERDVALKVMRPLADNRSDGQMMQRLLEEARAQARVSHPNVVQVYYVDAQGEIPFLAMEFVSGQTLESRLRESDVPFAEIIDIAVQTARALRAAAVLNIMHGDIKPANLLITHQGTIKLSDFGLARPVNLLSNRSAGISGTPNYLSPEACSGKQTDHRSDMYSLGVVLFQTTFGRLPYDVAGESLMTRLTAHTGSPVEYPQNWPSEIPFRWKNVLDKLLAKNPADRYQTFDELLCTLDHLRPLEVPAAGRLGRLIAWVIDLASLYAILQGLRIISQSAETAAQHVILSTLIAQICVAALVISALIQAFADWSPGKHLMQIRIVDDHGLKVRRSHLFLRACVQQAPVWGIVALRMFTGFGMDLLGWTVALVLGAFSMIDSAFALFRPDRQSFHDLLFRTNVVINTKSSSRNRVRPRRRIVRSARNSAVSEDQTTDTHSANQTPRQGVGHC